jgi:hypothetical protein
MPVITWKTGTKLHTSMPLSTSEIVIRPVAMTAVAVPRIRAVHPMYPITATA